ncbi:MAG: hypothetical protein A3D94_17905 [Alphaproteobacteria bacterium RIFCSPHIGHO2_12_FULL_66_14]|jgi:hypothetical protein|nr:MAG: hypothetical protein A3D94_17905 [Alphaproteobacteria bacterium RIFCSPHIGHO2_12_FULL_66_14]
MKFRFVALALLAATASVASAHVLMPVPAQNGTSPRTNGLSLPFPIAVPSIAVPLKLSALPTRNALEAGTTRSPVPLLLGHRRPFVPAAGASWDSSSPGSEAAPAGKMTETAAKAAIEADGYKVVRALSRGTDGVWTARALRGGTEVQLSVNSAGDVSAN